MDKEEIIDNFKNWRDIFNKKFLDREDEHEVLRENTRLDNLLGRDSMQYMRLKGIEKSFFISSKGCDLYKKRPNGKYKH